MKYDPQEHLRKARERARAAGLPQPRTGEDVERLTGFAWFGPDPAVVGRTYTVSVRTWGDR